VRLLEQQDVEAAVLGGSVLAGGGGGWASHGRELGEVALRYGSPRLVTLDEVDPAGVIVIVSAIGSPAAEGWMMRPRDYVRALELLMANWAGRVVGVMPAQNGAGTTTNGWVQASVLGLPVVDAAGNGHAHPTGKMGAMGLAGDTGLRTIQTGAGGDPARGLYMEVVAIGTVVQTADLLRQTAVKAGGFVANARTPLSIPFIRDHAAAGAVSYALDLGRAVAAALPNGAEAAIAATAARVGGRIVCRGELTHRVAETKGGFDLGMITIAADAAGGRVFELSLCNEYMTVESQGPREPRGERLATFPDLIATLALDTGLPVSAAQTEVGQGVALLVADKANLPLGGGMRDPTVYPEVEAMIGKDLATYALAGRGGEGR